jgi:NADP-dependent 3-hydroxy acid dehydrogenase YdfG
LSPEEVEDWAEAIVNRLSQAGASVVLTGRGLDALKKVEAQISAVGGQALSVQADMTSLKDSQKVIDQAVQVSGAWISS